MLTCNMHHNIHLPYRLDNPIEKNKKTRALTGRELPNLPHQQSWIYQNNSILLSVADTLVS